MTHEGISLYSEREGGMPKGGYTVKCPRGDMLFNPELKVRIIFYIPNKLKVPNALKSEMPALEHMRDINNNFDRLLKVAVFIITPLSFSKNPNNFMQYHVGCLK